MVKLKKFWQENYQFALCILLFAVILYVSLNPKNYIDATFSGITVWAKIVLPSLFVFFVLTKIFMSMKNSQKVFAFLDKPFCRFYNVKNYGGYIFLISAVAGYPIGAKLISEFYESGQISATDAHRIVPFASTSGPMFILGSIATKMFGDIKIGIVVLLSHLLGALINGLLYKKIKVKENISRKTLQETYAHFSLNSIVYDSIISILMVGGYIALCFAGVELLLKLIFPLSKILSNASFAGIFECIIRGFVELTSGCVAVAKGGFSTKFIAILLSCLVSFGGLSIHLQSQMFLSKVGIKYKYFFLTKITHTFITFVLSLVLSFLIL